MSDARLTLHTLFNPNYRLAFEKVTGTKLRDCVWSKPNPKRRPPHVKRPKS